MFSNQWRKLCHKTWQESLGIASNQSEHLATQHYQQQIIETVEIITDMIRNTRLGAAMEAT
jgi:hypothetical protein